MYEYSSSAVTFITVMSGSPRGGEDVGTKFPSLAGNKRENIECFQGTDVKFSCANAMQRRLVMWAAFSCFAFACHKPTNITFTERILL